MELVEDDDVGTFQHWKQYCPLQGTHPFWPYQWAPPIQGVPGGWNTSRLKPTNTFIPNFPKHFWPKFNFLLFPNMWMGWKFRIGLDPSPFWMLLKKNSFFTAASQKTHIRGWDTPGLSDCDNVTPGVQWVAIPPLGHGVICDKNTHTFWDLTKAGMLQGREGKN